MGIGILAKSGERRAAIIGGSMNGLFAANLLARAGWRADIYERAETELSGCGAGIVTHAAMRTVLRAAGRDPSLDLGIEVAGRKTLDRAGGVTGRHACPQTLASWDRVFRMLREKFPPQRYHLGKELRHVAASAGGVVAHFGDGTAVEAELMVGAMGSAPACGHRFSRMSGRSMPAMWRGAGWFPNASCRPPPMRSCSMPWCSACRRASSA